MRQRPLALLRALVNAASGSGGSVRTEAAAGTMRGCAWGLLPGPASCGSLAAAGSMALARPPSILAGGTRSQGPSKRAAAPCAPTDQQPLRADRQATGKRLHDPPPSHPMATHACAHPAWRGMARAPASRSTSAASAAAAPPAAPSRPRGRPRKAAAPAAFREAPAAGGGAPAAPAPAAGSPEPAAAAAVAEGLAAGDPVEAAVAAAAAAAGRRMGDAEQRLVSPPSALI